MPRNYADADEFMTFLDSRIIICPTNEGVSFFRIKKDGTFIAEEVEEEDIDTFNLTASLGLLRRKRMDRIASLKKRIKKLQDEGTTLKDTKETCEYVEEMDLFDLSAELAKLEMNELDIMKFLHSKGLKLSDPGFKRMYQRIYMRQRRANKKQGKNRGAPILGRLVHKPIPGVKPEPEPSLKLPENQIIGEGDSFAIELVPWSWLSSDPKNILAGFEHIILDDFVRSCVYEYTNEQLKIIIKLYDRLKIEAFRPGVEPYTGLSDFERLLFEQADIKLKILEIFQKNKSS